MASEKEFGKRIENESLGATRISNEILKCKDCIARFDDKEKFGNTSVCDIFPTGKPNGVLLGGECDEYIKER